MKKSNSKFAAFIDNKYIPLDKKIKIALAVLMIIIPVGLFYFLYFQSSSKKIVALEVQRNQLQKEIQNLREKERNKPQLLAQVAKVREEFDRATEMLPEQKEIPKLLKDISALGRNAGLDFLTFVPRPDIPRDFYSEVPVDITVRGPYHSMGFFLDQVSKLDRIVSVSNIDLSNPSRVQGEMLLNSQCQLVTYIFTNKKLEPAKK